MLGYTHQTGDAEFGLRGSDRSFPPAFKLFRSRACVVFGGMRFDARRLSDTKVTAAGPFSDADFPHASACSRSSNERFPVTSCMSEAPISGRAQDNIRSLQIHGEVIWRFLEVRREDRTFWFEVPAGRAAAGQQEGCRSRRRVQARSAGRTSARGRTARAALGSPGDTPVRGCARSGTPPFKSVTISCGSFERPRLELGFQWRRFINFRQRIWPFAAVEREPLWQFGRSGPEWSSRSSWPRRTDAGWFQWRPRRPVAGKPAARRSGLSQLRGLSRWRWRGRRGAMERSRRSAQAQEASRGNGLRARWRFGERVPAGRARRGRRQLRTVGRRVSADEPGRTAKRRGA